MINNIKLLLLGFILCILSCTQNNVTIDNSLKKYFDANKVIGCFALFDNGQGQFLIYNLPRYKDSSFLPASTFKIVNSLIGLQTGRIVNKNMIIKWDGVVRSHTEWNKDLTMQQAFKVSAVPYYQEVARRIGRDTMQYWLDSLQYGNHKIGNHIDGFWLDNSLKITPDEELGLVKKLYFDQLPFQKRVQQTVKEVMVQEKNASYTLCYKTGLANKENGNALGWVVGWIEENKHPYFFVLNIEGSPDLDMVSIRMNMLKSILKQYGFFEGKK